MVVISYVFRSKPGVGGLQGNRPGAALLDWQRVWHELKFGIYIDVLDFLQGKA